MSEDISELERLQQQLEQARETIAKLEKQHEPIPQPQSELFLISQLPSRFKAVVIAFQISIDVFHVVFTLSAKTVSYMQVSFRGI